MSDPFRSRPLKFVAVFSLSVGEAAVKHSQLCAKGVPLGRSQMLERICLASVRNRDRGWEETYRMTWPNGYQVYTLIQDGHAVCVVADRLQSATLPVSFLLAASRRMDETRGDERWQRLADEFRRYNQEERHNLHLVLPGGAQSIQTYAGEAWLPEAENVDDVLSEEAAGEGVPRLDLRRFVREDPPRVRWSDEEDYEELPIRTPRETNALRWVERTMMARERSLHERLTATSGRRRLFAVCCCGSVACTWFWGCLCLCGALCVCTLLLAALLVVVLTHSVWFA